MIQIVTYSLDLKIETVLESKILVKLILNYKTLHSWQFSENPGDCFQTLAFGHSLVLSLAWAILPGTVQIPMLACAVDDQSIRLYVEQDSQVGVTLLYFCHVLCCSELCVWLYYNFRFYFKSVGTCVNY